MSRRFIILIPIPLARVILAAIIDVWPIPHVFFICPDVADSVLQCHVPHCTFVGQSVVSFEKKKSKKKIRKTRGEGERGGRGCGVTPNGYIESEQKSSSCFDACMALFYIAPFGKKKMQKKQ